MERLGADWPTARAWNPRLVYCSISAYGQDGPRRDLPGHDLNLQALSGLSWLERDSRDRPQGLVLPIADFSSAMSAVAAIGLALAARGTDGPGRHLDIAMADAVLSFTNVWSTGIDLAAPVRNTPVPDALRDPLAARLDRERIFALPHYGLFKCRDGKWLSIGIVDERHFWTSLCTALGFTPLGRLGLPTRVLLGPLIRRAIALRLRGSDRASWLERLAKAGVPVSPVLTPAEALQDPHVRARGLVERDGVRPPIPGARVPAAHAPDLGQHTAAVLAELGLPSA
jgi:crotonobetainyl-CoA:carnitine CoA-transferase CaiB-like acyl-CoA transferase